MKKQLWVFLSILLAILMCFASCKAEDNSSDIAAESSQLASEGTVSSSEQSDDLSEPELDFSVSKINAANTVGVLIEAFGNVCYNQLDCTNSDYNYQIYKKNVDGELIFMSLFNDYTYYYDSRIYYTRNNGEKQVMFNAGTEDFGPLPDWSILVVSDDLSYTGTDQSGNLAFSWQIQVTEENEGNMSDDWKLSSGDAIECAAILYSDYRFKEIHYTAVRADGSTDKIAIGYFTYGTAPLISREVNSILETTEVLISLHMDDNTVRSFYTNSDCAVGFITDEGMQTFDKDGNAIPDSGVLLKEATDIYLKKQTK